MVEKITQYKVGDTIYDNEDDAVKAETENKLYEILHIREVTKASVTSVLSIGNLLEMNKELWEAMVNYCGALKPFHEPKLSPIRNWLGSNDPSIQPTYSSEEVSAFTIIPTRDLDGDDDE